MKYDFNEVFPAPGTDAPMRTKLAKKGITDPDAVCYGVAEMKFPTLPEIIDALEARVKTGGFGYSSDTSAYAPAVVKWFKTRHDWDVLPEQIINTSGVVCAIGFSIRAFTKPGDGIIIQSPVYNPFAEQVRKNGRVVLENCLIRTEDRYEIDFEDFEAKAKLPTTTMFVLCSPHNPVGRVWSREELQRLADICDKYGVFVVSDEIHNDITYNGEHTVFAKLNGNAAKRAVVCTAPSKTFNIPGLSLSNIVVQDPEVREKFANEMSICVGHYMNSVAMAGAAAAFNEGAQWVDEMCAYIKQNADNMQKYLKEYLPQVWAPKMEGTYLAWLDFSYLGMTDEELKRFFLEDVKVSINTGATYGKGGEGFVRLNIGCPDRYVLKFIQQTAEALKKIGK